MDQLDKHYWDLFARNWPIVSREIQYKIAQLKIGFAGCGSVGGAFIDGALRVGVLNYKLADTGDYDLNNLNRQMVTAADINVNKAVAYERKIKSINRLANVNSTYTDGVCEKNVDDFLNGVDFVFDGVDVTTESGIANKLLLHEKAAQRKIPVVAALDLGFTQWIRTYDYRQGMSALEGRLDEARRTKHPLKALIGPVCPVEDLPLEITIELIRLFQDPNGSACQLGSVCFLLAGLVHPLLVHFIEKNTFPPLIQMDLLVPFLTPAETIERAQILKEKHTELRKLLVEIN